MKKVLLQALFMAACLLPLSAIADCGAPTNLYKTNMTTTDLNLHWDAVAGATTYVLQYRVRTVNTWHTISGITTNVYHLAGLTPSTIYMWKVKAVCSSGISAWSVTSKFKTRTVMPLIAPNNSEVSSTNGTTLRISPNPVTDQFSVQTPLAPGETATIEVADLKGAIVRRIDRITNEITEVQVSDLPAGMYIVRSIISNGTVSTGKMMKK